MELNKTVVMGITEIDKMYELISHSKELKLLFMTCPGI